MARKSQVQVGGALQVGTLYIERSADARLATTLREGRYAVVFAPRQTGKSSLRRRVEEQLRGEGRRAYTLDLLQAGRDDPGRWYRNLVEALSLALGKPRPGPFWKEREELSPSARFWAYLREAVAEEDRPLVLFIDEVDAVTQVVDLDADGFFQGLKVARDAAATDPVWARFCCCLLGVVNERDLVRDPELAPSNAGYLPIDLADFTRAELAALEAHLPGEDAAAMVDAIFAAVGGHPYQCMRLARALIDEGPAGIDAVAQVEALVEAIFIQQGLLREASLYWPRAHIERLPGGRRDEAMELYRRALLGRRPRPGGPNSALADLRVAGLVSVEVDGRIGPRSRVFSTVLGMDWVNLLLGARLFDGALLIWEANDRGPAHLLGANELQAAREWLAMQAHPTQAMRAFVTASARALEAQLLEEAEAAKADAARRHMEALELLLRAERGALKIAEERSEREAVEAKAARMMLDVEMATAERRQMRWWTTFFVLGCALVGGIAVAWSMWGSAHKARAEQQEAVLQADSLARAAGIAEQAHLQEKAEKEAELARLEQERQERLAEMEVLKGQSAAERAERERLADELEELTTARAEAEDELQAVQAEGARVSARMAERYLDQEADRINLVNNSMQLREELDACQAREARWKEDLSVQVARCQRELQDPAPPAALLAPPRN